MVVCGVMLFVGVSFLVDGEGVSAASVPNGRILKLDASSPWRGYEIRDRRFGGDKFSRTRLDSPLASRVVIWVRRVDGERGLPVSEDQRVFCV